jgi:hypothetical protein
VGGGERISSFCKYQRKPRKTTGSIPFLQFLDGVYNWQRKKSAIGNDKKEEKCLAK